MRFKRASLLAAGAVLAAAGTTAVAAETLHKMQVPLPDGGTVHVEYAGDVAPKVTVEQAPRQARVVAYDPFAELDRIAYQMRLRQQAMLRQMAALQQAAAQGGAAAAPGGVTLVGNVPAGTRVSYFSSTTDANGCTQTVQYSSDGSGAEPRVTRASTGSCESASASEAAPAPAAAPARPRKLDDNDV